MWERGRIRLLAVDDEAEVRAFIAEALQGTHFACSTASAYDEAVRLAASEPVDLLLCDIIIPPFHGRDLANRLVHSHPDLKVLFMSGYPPKLLRQHSLLSPTAAFLAKPFSPSELLSALDEAWESGRPWTEATLGAAF
jgi:CheY-like chemotaxis protein